MSAFPRFDNLERRVNKFVGSVDVEQLVRPSVSKPRRRGFVLAVCSFFVRHLGFSLVVVLPTLLAVVYYGLIAAPVYVATAQFVVKSGNQSPTLSGVGQLLQNAGLAVSANDAYAVGAYMTSRDALKELEKSSDIRSVYTRPEADFVARFPNFYTLFRPAFEYLYWHYCNWIEVDFNSTTNITTIYSYAFQPDDAQTIARQLLELGERQVNQMNDRVKRDALSVMRDEVKHLSQRSEEIQKELTEFRNNEQVLDPNQASTAATTLRSTLEVALVAARAQLGQLEASAPASPQIPPLQVRIKALEDQVSAEERKNLGGANTLAPKLSKYDGLLLQQQFAQQMLQAAISSLEAAEINVQNQLLYLERISEPLAPDWPQYPYRIADTALVFVTVLSLYIIGKIMVTATMDHFTE
jgi:capsular polysaccharide transport system permease protein